MNTKGSAAIRVQISDPKQHKLHYLLKQLGEKEVCSDGIAKNKNVRAVLML